MIIKCNFNGAIICSIVFVGGVAALFKVGIVDGMFNDIPFEEVTTEFLNYIFAKKKQKKRETIKSRKDRKTCNGRNNVVVYFEMEVK